MAILAGLVKIDEIEGVKSERELVMIECEMLRHAMVQAISAMGPELAAAYPKAKVAGSEKVLTFKEAQEILSLAGEASLTSEEESGLGRLMEEQGC